MSDQPDRTIELLEQILVSVEQVVGHLVHESNDRCASNCTCTPAPKFSGDCQLDIEDEQYLRYLARDLDDAYRHDYGLGATITLSDELAREIAGCLRQIADKYWFGDD